MGDGASDALTWILNAQNLSEMPPRPASAFGYGCEECPFATVTPGEEVNWSDPSEGYYDCSLIGQSRIWGESPRCTIENWRARARDEAEALDAESVKRIVSAALSE